MDSPTGFFLYLRKLCLHCCIGRVSYFLHYTELHSSVTMTSVPALVHRGWIQMVGLILCQVVLWALLLVTWKAKSKAALGSGCTGSLSEGVETNLLGPKPPTLDISRSRGGRVFSGWCFIATILHWSPTRRSWTWEWAESAELLGAGDCGHMEDKIHVFLQNFHLRVFTFNIFLKQFKEQKK